MADRNLYEVLGVSRSASEADIRKAYREIARASHPDRNPGDQRAEDRFKEASYAKEILLNGRKRALYDEFGTAGLRDGFDPSAYRAYTSGGRRTARRPSQPRPGSGYSQEDLEDFFTNVRNSRNAAGNERWTGSFQDFVSPDVVDSIFGRTRAAAPNGPRPTRRDLLSEITVSFAESIRGVEKELAFNPPGEEDKERVLRVRIPPGVTPGGRVRLRGQGTEGGDLVLQVNVEEHPFFSREGSDLHVALPITLLEAYQGARIPLPTPDGEVMLTIPPGTQGGAKLRLRNKGVTRGQTSGDLIVTVHVRLPDARSERVEALMKEASVYYSDSPRAGLKF